MLQFILNNTKVSTSLPAGTLLLDFIRYHQHLKGTKIGCREGDCGACTILVGERQNGDLHYTNATSCLMPIGNAAGKHIVTIEGINLKELNALQQSFAENGATQCGFCTPGFIVSLAGFCMSKDEPSQEKAIKSIDGNICRCTGYKSIERAAEKINLLMQERNGREPLAFAVANQIIPEYFLEIKEKLFRLLQVNGENGTLFSKKKILGGGTDLYVQQHETMVKENILFLFDKKELNGIASDAVDCTMGASTTVADIAASDVFQQHFPGLDKYIKLVSSTPIRNMATIAGNFCNASPIGDFSIFFLALDAQISISNGTQKRNVPLRSFFKSYKVTDKTDDEFIEQISCTLPGPEDFFNFEKVSKRTHLDIASVNTAINLKIENGLVKKAGLSAGGVGPIPLFLKEASAFLEGKSLDEGTVNELLTIVNTEIAPISDARGTAEYKTLLLQQLVKAHFLKLMPALNL